VQDAELLAKRPPDDEQRLDQHGQVGAALDKLFDMPLELHRPVSILRPNLRKVPRRSLSMAIAFDFRRC
jgi:hypothetical protein